MMKRFLLGTMMAATVAVAAPAVAAPTLPSYTFAMAGSSAVNGSYGNAMSFSTSDPTLKLSVTAWQSNLATNAITSAYLGAYAGGLGVTGKGDANGGYNLHQIDNVGGYTDFLLLEFNRAVTLTSVITNSYGIFGDTDNDAVWYDAGQVTTPAWNSTAGFSGYSTVPALWSDVAAGGSGVSRDTGALTASTKWLIGAAFDPLCDRDDGFKLASITVRDSVSAVPEPAAWAMMILGFGLAGVALRRERRRTAALA